MYLPPHHREDRIEVQHALIRAHPFATLVTLGSNGLFATQAPILLDPAAGPFGTLKAHVARANPQWRDFKPEVEALGIFQGVERYITPSWYATKAETGKVVPTWNYATVHAYGPLSIVEDRDWLRTQVEALTRLQESSRSAPWSVSDAPEQFIESQIRGIVGFKIPISRIEGKWKVSQNRPEADRVGVIEGLRAAGDPEAERMADLVAERDRPH